MENKLREMLGLFFGSTDEEEEKFDNENIEIDPTQEIDDEDFDDDSWKK